MLISALYSITPLRSGQDCAEGLTSGESVSRTRTTTFGFWLTLLTALLLGSLPALAQTASEQSLRAAFVFNLTKYVEWPETSSPEFLIGVIGDGPTSAQLKQSLDHKLSRNKVIRVLLSPTPQELERCSIVYVSHSSKPKIAAGLERVPKVGVLTVGEDEQFTRVGGIVGLVAVGDHIQVQIDPIAAASARLKISSRLMSIGTIVHNKGAKE